jgi:uncharacterized protein (TIGR03000 family)
MRTTAALALTLILCASTEAQVIIRTRPIRTAPQPVGVIPAPALGISPGALTPPGVMAPRPTPRPYLAGNPYYGLWGGYAPFWPGYYDAPLAPTVVNNYIPVPTAPAVTQTPPPPPELRARLTLHVPPGAKVWLAGKEVDAAASPLILESPVLSDEQSYTFDIKVTWFEGRTTEERTRQVTIHAGESKSLTYMAAR